DNRRVAQLRRAACLALEPIGLSWHGAGAAHGVAARHLDGHDPVQLRVARLVDGAESPGADRLQQLKLAEPAPGLLRVPGRRDTALPRGDRGATTRTNHFPADRRGQLPSVLALLADNMHFDDSEAVRHDSIAGEGCAGSYPAKRLASLMRWNSPPVVSMRLPPAP